jgi:hypothetical protein
VERALLRCVRRWNRQAEALEQAGRAPSPALARALRVVADGLAEHWPEGGRPSEVTAFLERLDRPGAGGESAG